MESKSKITSIDIAIVGSGPAGASVALHLIQQNPDWAKRIIVIEKAVHPREKLCGGGITYLGLDVLARLGLAFEPSHFNVREVRLVFQELSYAFRADPAFRIVRRAEFDHWLVKQLQAHGVAVHQGEAVTNITTHPDHVELTTTKKTVHAQVVVAADGSRSFIRQRLKMNDGSHVARLLEILTPEDEAQQPEFKNKTAIFDFTPMVGNRLQGYYWDFPSYVDGKAFMNRGVFDSRSRPERAKADLKGTLRQSLANRNKNLDDFKLKGHPIRIFDKKGTFAMPRILLVGDAAGVDPLFGEGIAFALGYGEPASQAIIKAFDQADFLFENYRKQLIQQPLFRHLHLRVRLAQIGYRIKSPRLFRIGWRVAGTLINLTPWRNAAHKPNRVPEIKPKNHAEALR